MSLAVIATAAATKPEGGIDLARYPGLTYAPAQHGPGIRFAHNGKPVETLLAAQEGEEHRAGAPLDVANDIGWLAGKFGVSFADVCDALKYLSDHGRI